MLNKQTHFHIVGLGLMGGSIAMGLKKHGFTVTAMDIDPNAIEYALQHHLIDEGALKKMFFCVRRILSFLAFILQFCWHGADSMPLISSLVH